MWLEIDTKSFAIKQSGFIKKQTADGRLVFVHPENQSPSSVNELTECDRGLVVEIDLRTRRIRFGRDYLGQFPLLYISHKNQLFFSDDFQEIDHWVKQKNIELTLSEEALALYFAMGFVPHGMTLYEQIVACENTSVYQWENGQITRTSTFVPIEIDPQATVAEVGRQIEHEVGKIAANAAEIDVWCSGGIDSSVMAYCFNTNGRKADIVTLGYGDMAPEVGDGEIRYAQMMADACNAPLRYAQIDTDSYFNIYSDFLAGHIGPIIDTCAPPKYALSKVSRQAAITGEGGDPLFGGVKNNSVVYTHAMAPNIPLAWVYAKAHNRYVDRLPEILKHGEELKAYVKEYFDNQLARYPGDLIRKMFYLNTILKQGSMIFPQSYYPQIRYGTTIYHPLSHLSVYKAAFSLEDRKRYVYPHGKLVLKELYGDVLPQQIIDRKKSGTLVPMREYIKQFQDSHFKLTEIEKTGLFNEQFIKQASVRPGVDDEHLLVYGTLTLNLWIRNRRGNNNEQLIPLKAGSM